MKAQGINLYLKEAKEGENTEVALRKVHSVPFKYRVGFFKAFCSVSSSFISSFRQGLDDPTREALAPSYCPTGANLGL